MQSSVQRDLYPSPVPTFRKAVDNTSLHGLLYTALHANGLYITSKEGNRQQGANSIFRVGRVVESSPALSCLPRWYGLRELHKYLLILQVLQEMEEDAVLEMGGCGKRLTASLDSENSGGLRLP